MTIILKQYRELVSALKRGLRHVFGARDRYVGDYKYGQYHGQGTMTYADGDKYVGEYVEGNRHLHGMYTFSNGDKYVGEYKNGTRHGQGMYITASEIGRAHV